MIPEDIPVFKTCFVAVPPPTLSRLREIPRVAGFLRSDAGLVTALMGQIMSFHTIIRIPGDPAMADLSAMGAINRPLLNVWAPHIPATEKPKKINLNPLLTVPFLPYDTE
jgi:hypothetical protein